MRQQSSYTYPTIKRAVALALSMGTKAASTHLGFPYATVRGWRQRFAYQEPRRAKPKAPRPNLSQRQRDILAALQMHGPMQARDVCDMLGSDSEPVHINRRLNALVKRGFCVRTGTGKPHTYALKEL